MSASPVRLSVLAPTPTVGVDASAAAPGKGLQSVKNQPLRSSHSLHGGFHPYILPSFAAFKQQFTWTSDAPA